MLTLLSATDDKHSFLFQDKDLNLFSSLYFQVRNLSPKEEKSPFEEVFGIGWKVKESTNVTKDQIILSAWRSKKTHCFAIITTYQYIFALLWVCTLKSTMFKFHHSFHFKRSLSTCYKLKKYISWPLCQSLLKGGSNIQKFHFEWTISDSE